MSQKNIWQRKHLKVNKTDGKQEIQNEQNFFSVLVNALNVHRLSSQIKIT